MVSYLPACLSFVLPVHQSVRRSVRLAACLCVHEAGHGNIVLRVWLHYPRSDRHSQVGADCEGRWSCISPSSSLLPSPPSSPPVPQKLLPWVPWVPPFFHSSPTTLCDSVSKNFSESWSGTVGAYWCPHCVVITHACRPRATSRMPRAWFKSSVLNRFEVLENSYV